MKKDQPPKRKRPTKRTSSKRTRKKSPRGSARKRKSTDSKTPRIVYLGLGSNRGNGRAYLEAALSEIERFAAVRHVSSFYRSDPVGYTHQPEFWNAVAEIAWSGSPRNLLATLKAIERQLGRTPTFRNGPREIDLDILDFGGLVGRGPGPILPHPRLAVRRFALTPLGEIAPRWRHPITGQTAREMLASLPRKPGVRRVRRPAGR